MHQPSMHIDWLAKPRRAVSREFLADAPIRAARHDDLKGYLVKVRLTSYRSLPLSCIESIALRINGADIRTEALRLLLDSHCYTLAELGHQGSRWWFILDYAHLFFPGETDLAEKPVDVEGTLVTVEPYITAGRFSFTHVSRRRLSVQTLPDWQD